MNRPIEGKIYLKKLIRRQKELMATARETREAAKKDEVNKMCPTGYLAEQAEKYEAEAWLFADLIKKIAEAPEGVVTIDEDEEDLIHEAIVTERVGF